MNNSKFKIGDKVITTLGHIGTIINIKDNKYEVFFKTDSALINSKRLKLYNIMDNINKNLFLCKKGKHKLRINKFGVTWCVRCGLLSNTLNAELLKDKKK